MKKKYSSIIFLFIVISCSNNSTYSPNTNSAQTIDSVHFISNNYIEIDKIKQISKFRSGIGHNYSDDFEQCLSMKHYFYPYDSVNWSNIKVYSPVDGKVVRLDTEWAGVQIHIQPSKLSQYNIIIFHLNFTRPISIGDLLKSGEQIGTHIGSQTYSDIAVSSSSGGKYKLLSYFDVLPDSLFQKFITLGANSRNDFIISKESRGADPLGCISDSFSTSGNIENWFYLKK